MQLPRQPRGRRLSAFPVKLTYRDFTGVIALLAPVSDNAVSREESARFQLQPELAAGHFPITPHPSYGRSKVL
jgi:hypothetical protein